MCFTRPQNLHNLQNLQNYTEFTEFTTKDSKKTHTQTIENFVRGRRG